MRVFPYGEFNMDISYDKEVEDVIKYIYGNGENSDLSNEIVIDKIDSMQITISELDICQATE